MRKRIVTLSLLCGLLAWQPALSGTGWQTHSFPGIPATRFSMAEGGVIEIAADSSAGLYYRPLSAAEVRDGALRWRWRVEQAPQPLDLTRKGSDRAVAVMIAFPREEDSLLGWMGRGLARLAGAPLSGRVISYVWGGRQPAGSAFPDPYLGADGYVVVLRAGSAPQGRWIDERVNPIEDYRRLFGDEPSAPGWVAIASDSDQSGASTRASVAGL